MLMQKKHHSYRITMRYITLPLICASSIDLIGFSAFEESGLTSIVIPTSVTFIGMVMIEYCSFFWKSIIRFCLSLACVRPLFQPARSVVAELPDIHSWRIPIECWDIAVDYHTHVRARMDGCCSQDIIHIAVLPTLPSFASELLIE